MRLRLIRHGETDWNLQGRYQGRADTRLCATGIVTARRLAARLDPRAEPLLVTSPLQRASATAALIASALGTAVALPDQRLREIDFGEWQGLTQSQVKLRWPGMLRRWKQAPESFRFPGGESLEDALERLRDFLRRPPWAPQWGGEVLAVSHAGMIRLAGLIGEDRPLAHFREIEVSAGAVHDFEWCSGGALRRLECG